jgi:hypothetical protein
MEHRRRKRRLPNPPIRLQLPRLDGLWPLIGLLFSLLALLAGYLAVSRSYEEQAGENKKSLPPKTAADSSPLAGG